jgi:Uncharacterized conserved protein (DUF2075)
VSIGVSRAYYLNSIGTFLEEDIHKIFGKLATEHSFALEDLQKNAWLAQIEILKNQLKMISEGHIAFEYTIPRMGKRVDVILLFQGIVFVIEFKVGERIHSIHSLDQVLDYSLDLKNFHKQSHNRVIVPILIATEAMDVGRTLEKFQDNIYVPIKANKHNIGQTVYQISESMSPMELNPETWFDSPYQPTPTIIEAAQRLYRGHTVKDISRSDALAANLTTTTQTISNIINESKHKKLKSICFVTGVPGAGKTLAGLNIANERLKIDENEHSVFLSGNGSLVEVLREALARNQIEETESTKSEALSKASTFIQNIHHFRDDALFSPKPPTEKVVIFDEAQRAWTAEQTASFMQRKKGVQNFKMSEPEFLVSVLDRHEDWATIICLIGGGQEINIGEAGLPEWFSALSKKFPHWQVHVSSKISDFEYTHNIDLLNLINVSQLHVHDTLHLSVSMRSFRSENVSALIKSLLDCEVQKAKDFFTQIQKNYPIFLTRNLESAKQWLRGKARGSERYGVVASSGAHRLKAFAINVKAEIDPKHWFLNGKDDVRSSYYLEDTATEFDVQGLELDWICVAWDCDLRFGDNKWEFKTFKGTKWQNIADLTRQLYLKNAYRVLLTRARQGMIIFIPEGNDLDQTRKPEFYDGTFNYLKSIGLPVI